MKKQPSKGGKLVEIKYLLIRESNEKVQVLYDGNATPFLLPKIGLRPPYYENPKFQPYYPVI